MSDLKPLREVLAADDFVKTCEALLRIGGGELPPAGSACLLGYQCRQPEIDELKAELQALHIAVMGHCKSDPNKWAVPVGQEMYWVILPGKAPADEEILTLGEAISKDNIDALADSHAELLEACSELAEHIREYPSMDGKGPIRLENRPKMKAAYHAWKQAITNAESIGKGRV